MEPQEYPPPEFVPAEGRSVVYQLASGQYRPAQIVRVWSVDGLRTCNLVVFVDGANDRTLLGVGEAEHAPVISRSSVVLGDLVGQYLPRRPPREVAQ